MYGDFFYFSGCARGLPAGRQVRRSGKFLRSFGKLWEAVLPTFLLRINEVDENCAVEKIAQFRYGIREFYLAKVLMLRRFTSGNDVFSFASVRKFSFRSCLTPFEMTGTIGQFYLLPSGSCEGQ